MGNQNSRLERRLGSTASQDPRLIPADWIPSSNNDPDHRQYPLPVVASLRTNNGRVKVRKHSSPLISSTSSSSSSISRRPLSRVFPFRPFRSANSSLHTNTPHNLTPASSIMEISSTSSSSNNNNQHHLATSLHPLSTGHHQSPSSNSNSSFYGNTLQPVNSNHSHTNNNNNNNSSSLSNNNNNNNNIMTPSSSHHSLLQDVSTRIKSDLLLDSNDIMWIGGRKFHSCQGSAYILPCDEEEIDRLHLLHFMVRFAIQGNYLAPVTDTLRKGANVLDIGCGPGSWSMEIAGEYPKSTIVGVDMVPLFPRDIKPSNCLFYQSNILNGLPFQDGTFDYVFMRFMGLGIENDQWETLLNDIIRILKPGGWIEIVEVDSELHRTGPSTKFLNDQLMALIESKQLDQHSGRRLKERFETRDDLTNINTTFISCPAGQWAGKLGQLTLQSWKFYYQAIRPQICLHTNMDPDEYNKKLEACWAEVDEYKTFENVHFAYAQKKST